MKTTVYIATSIDGFIARENGGIDWLPTGNNAEVGEDYGYQELMDSVDAIVMGRNTFELVLSFEEWAYGEKPVIVLSGQQMHIPDRLAKTVEWMEASPQTVIHNLAARGFEHLYIDGGKTIQGFLKEGLIQQLIMTKVPILIGAGIPLFGSIPHDVKLRHVRTRSFGNGLVQSEYEVAGNAVSLSV
jgi:dihydrofolate reductase